MAFIVSPTTRADFDELEKPPPYRLFGLTARNEHGDIIGIGGIAYLEDGRKLAFADLTDEARHHKVALHKAGHAIMKMVRAKGIKCVIATASKDVGPAAERWLARFGFNPEMHSNQTVWVWRDEQ